MDRNAFSRAFWLGLYDKGGSSCKKPDRERGQSLLSKYLHKEGATSLKDADEAQLRSAFNSMLDDRIFIYPQHVLNVLNPTPIPRKTKTKQHTEQPQDIPSNDYAVITQADDAIPVSNDTIELSDDVDDAFLKEMEQETVEAPIPEDEQGVIEWADEVAQMDIKPRKADNVPQVSEPQPEKTQSEPMFHLLTADEATQGKDLEWKIKNLVPRTGMGQICGQSRGAKTFFAMALCEAIVDGSQDFYGFKVQHKDPVVFICLEGEGGFRRRIKALEKWRAMHGKEPLPPEMRFIIGEHFAINNDKQVKALAALCPKNALIIIDTQNASAPIIDVNSTKDMGGIIQGAKTLKEITDGFVFLIAHEGLSATGRPMGSSVQIPNCDTLISVSCSQKKGEWKVGKMKDAEDGMKFSFRLEVVELGEDEDGETVTSCVAVPSDAPRPRKGLSVPQKLILDILKKAVKKSETKTVFENDLRDKFRTNYRTNRDCKEGSTDRAFRRAFDDLKSLGMIDLTNGVCSLKELSDTDKNRTKSGHVQGVIYRTDTDKTL